jgi:hypothetical protein
MPHKPTITLQPNVHRNEPIALLQFTYNRDLIDIKQHIKGLNTIVFNQPLGPM